MNRADRLKQAGDIKRGFTVGFALTVLQRRLASSPEAILKSLERRHKRLEKRRSELRYGDFSGEDQDLAARLRDLLGKDPTESDLNDFGSDGDDLPGGEAEDAEAEIADAATAARTIAELDKELAILADLTELARRVRRLGTDKKWTELRGILTDTMLAAQTRPAPDPAADGPAFPDPDGVLPGLGDYLPGNGAIAGQHILPAVHPSITAEQAPAPEAARKIIIFTEHRDTLEYLAERIRDLLGRSDAVVTIHGGVRREERRRVMELFTQDKDIRVLVATDAAGEGLNLQRAHLMVNYDLPWNPNRIEQRFGRIHRIGQTEVCHLWNLVADGTREGMVFLQLLTKIEEQRKAYHGKVFDVLGEAFQGQPLKDLLVEAIRYGNRPDVRARLHEVIDKTVGEGLDKLIAERAAHSDIFAIADLEKWRARMDEANAPPPPAALHQRLLPRGVQAARRPTIRTRVRPLRDPPRPRRHPRPRPADGHRPRPGTAQIRAGHLRQEPGPPRGQAEGRPARTRPPAPRRGHRPDHRTVRHPPQAGHHARRPARPRHRAPAARRRHPRDHRRPRPGPHHHQEVRLRGNRRTGGALRRGSTLPGLRAIG